MDAGGNCSGIGTSDQVVGDYAKAVEIMDVRGQHRDWHNGYGCDLGLDLCEQAPFLICEERQLLQVLDEVSKSSATWWR